MPTTGPLILHHNVMEGATVSSTAAGFDAAHLEDWRQYTFWKPSSLPATITKDTGAPTSVDYLLLDGGEFAGLTVTLRGSTDNFVGSDVVLGTAAVTTGKGCFLHLTTPVSYRYYRIQISGIVAPIISIAAVGLATEMPFGMGEGYDALAREEVGARNTNENGYPLGIVSKFEKIDRNLTFNLVDWEFLRDDWLSAWDAIKQRPFGFVWDPDGHPDEVDILMTDGGFDAPQMAGDMATITVQCHGVLTLFKGTVV